MASRILPEDLDQDIPTAKRRLTKQISSAKPEEGDTRGEVAHFLRAILLVVIATAAFGWLVS